MADSTDRTAAIINRSVNSNLVGDLACLSDRGLLSHLVHKIGCARSGLILITHFITPSIDKANSVHKEVT